MQSGWEQTRSAAKRVLRRGRAEMRAPWIGPTIANGLLPRSYGRERERYVPRLQPRLAPVYFLGRRTESAPERRPGPGEEPGGAGGGNRTLDHSLTKRMLCR